MHEYNELARTAYEEENGAQFLKSTMKQGAFTHYLEELTGYTYDVAVIDGKTVLFDNFSVSPFVVSDKQIDETNFLQSLEDVYGDTLTSHQINEPITEALVRNELANVPGIDVEKFVAEIKEYMKAKEDESFFATA